MSPFEMEFKELYDTRNNHEKRLSVVETNINHIMDEQNEIKCQIKGYHAETIVVVKEIQGVISKFIEEINGIPRRNAIDITYIREKKLPPIIDNVDSLRKFSWMLLGMGIFASFLMGSGIVGIIFGWFKKGSS